jgi:ELWxxDGT repeat protein
MKVDKQLAMFAAVDAGGQDGLWVTDGTALGTHELSSIQNAFQGGLFGGNVGFNPDITTFDGYALFEGVDASDYKRLWSLAAGVPKSIAVRGWPRVRRRPLFESEISTHHHCTRAGLLRCSRRTAVFRMIGRVAVLLKMLRSRP